MCKISTTNPVSSTCYAHGSFCITIYRFFLTLRSFKAPEMSQTDQ